MTGGNYVINYYIMHPSYRISALEGNHHSVISQCQKYSQALAKPNSTIIQMPQLSSNTYIYQVENRQCEDQKTGHKRQDEYEKTNKNRPNHMAKQTARKAVKSSKEIINNSTEKQKRKFVSQILNQVRNSGKEERLIILGEVCKQKGIDKFEGKVWVISYKIVFQIEESIQDKNNVTQKQLSELILKKIEWFAKKNHTQKKYMIIRIMKTVFNAFKISGTNYSQIYREIIAKVHNTKTENSQSQFEHSEDSFLKSKETKNRNGGSPFPLLQKHNSNMKKRQENNQVSRQVKDEQLFDEYSEMRNLSFGPICKDQRKQQKILDKQVENQKERVEKYIDLVHFQQNTQNTSPSSLQVYQGETEFNRFPLQFKKKVGEKLDQAFKNFFHSFISQNASQLCLEHQSIKQIFDHYSSFRVVQKSEETSKKNGEKINKKSKEEMSKKRQDKDIEWGNSRESSGVVDLNERKQKECDEKVMSFWSQKQKNKTNPDNLPSNPAFQIKNNLSSNPFQQLQTNMLAAIATNKTISTQQFQKQLFKNIHSIDFVGKLKRPILTKWTSAFINRYLPQLQQKPVDKSKETTKNFHTVSEKQCHWMKSGKSQKQMTNKSKGGKLKTGL